MTFTPPAPSLNTMTEVSQENEFDILGCKVTCNPSGEDRDVARSVIQLITQEVEALKKKRPSLRDTDVAVLVALKMATEKFKLEQDFKGTVLELEGHVSEALTELNS